ncbi:methyltransferase domain-containing protein [Candidatus Binatus sp.]|jgi:SAM-dependent methyltransferase|uniref:class I SAM-dependent methyltransferase n=1 Tax=Candidatus Binatus sp. TaxID=2811406 RepID=UPI003BC6CEE2
MNIPPASLRKRVHGSEDQASFELVGKTVAQDLLEVIKPRLQLNSQSNILDFGCGCARVMSYFDKRSASIYGTDIDAQAIAWCKESLAGLASFMVNNEWPPLAFENNVFDLILSVSVFTHLPEDMQLAWLGELKRVAKPGALVLLSIHGEHLISNDVRGHKEQILRDGHIYTKGPGTEGLPDFYQTTHHSEQYINKHWTEFFKIEAILTRRINNHQDLVVCWATG